MTDILERSGGSGAVPGVAAAGASGAPGAAAAAEARAPGGGAAALVAALALALAPIASVLAFVPRIPQSTAYHGFADARALIGIPNALDVLSNLPFAVVGVLGARFVLAAGRAGDARIASAAERAAWLGFFVGVGATALGSAWYHLAPDSARLVWDRVPMTVGFTSLLAAALGERVGPRAGGWALGPLVTVGLGSVAWWRLTEAAGAGDLRPYALVQAYPMVLIPLLLAARPARYTRGSDYLVAFGLYGLAKLAESLDRSLFEVSGALVSGHTVKHLLAGAATAWLLRMLARREPRRAG